MNVSWKVIQVIFAVEPTFYSVCQFNLSFKNTEIYVISDYSIIIHSIKPIVCYQNLKLFSAQAVDMNKHTMHLKRCSRSSRMSIIKVGGAQSEVGFSQRMKQGDKWS